MSLLCLLPGELESFILVQRRILKNSALAQQNNNSAVFIFGHASCEWRGDKGACFVLGWGGLKERKLLQRGQNFDPIDVLQEAVQLKPKPSNMSDFVNYSKHQLLTPR